jgi:hypothetical protein
VNPLITGNQPTVVATSNPLVALFSAPSCSLGSTMAVVFQQAGSAMQYVTDSRPCHHGTQNFYIRGMLANQTYTMYSQVTTGSNVVSGSPVSFTTGAVPASLPSPIMSTPVAPGPGTDAASGIALSGYAEPPYFPFATDLNANILWYYATPLQIRALYRAEPF